MSYFHRYCTGLDFPAFVLFAKKNNTTLKIPFSVLCAKTKTPKIPFLFCMQKKNEIKTPPRYHFELDQLSFQN